MTDRSELALQLTDAIAVARTAVERAGDRAFRAYGLSHRAHAALNAVGLESKGLVETTPDPEDERGVRVTLTRHGLEVLLRVGQLERRLAARAIEGMPASSIARAVHVLDEFKRRLEEKQIGVVR
ncbi:MAG: hypothetical protein AUH12_00045 [Gemmatimonadetes bacterium 13_2_20CM_69_8]|nr:MAG: hypothetical protein AUH12_00045 [Gemmatimonadetes bacterium 13_2_20CM_69_8]